MARLMYQVYDWNTQEVIGHITGAELREAAGRLPNSPVFNTELVHQFNENKSRMGEPERIREVIRD